MRLKQNLNHHTINDVEILGPTPAVIEKKQNTYRAELLLQSCHRGAIHNAITQSIHFMDNNPMAKSSKWILDVDPIDFF